MGVGDYILGACRMNRIGSWGLILPPPPEARFVMQVYRETSHNRRSRRMALCFFSYNMSVSHTVC